MARRLRLQYPGGIYHVMSRGNRKAAIYDDDIDRRRFLGIFREALTRYDVRCYAFCLMTNHYHLVLDTPRGNLSHAMRYLNGVYTQESNRHHQRSGHLLEGRFRSIVVEREAYLRHLARYIVLNPVRAGLAENAAAWTWSSYRATAGLAAVPSFLDVDWITWTFGGSRRDAEWSYRQFVNDGGALDDMSLHADGLAVGTPAFEAALRDTIAPGTIDRRLPRPWRALARPRLSDLFNIPELTRPRRNQLIREAHVTYGYRLAEIAAFLGLHPTTLSAALRRPD